MFTTRKSMAGLLNLQLRNASQHLKAFATIDPKNLSVENKGMNLVQGEWRGTE
jgi:1-pyrroline-5-carboxylate dehydrogenase